jgi:hypothetical protein
MLVVVPVFFVSMMGVSAVTVTVSSTVETLSVNARSTLTPVCTLTSRVTVVKPVSATVSL